MKQLGIIVTALSAYGLGCLLLVPGADTAQPMRAALWGAVGTAVLLYWPRSSILQVVTLCWLSLVLYGMSALELAGCTAGRAADAYMPSAPTLLIFITVPFLLILLPMGVLFLRSAYRDHMRGELEEAVLAAIDPLHGPQEGAQQKARRLLAKGTRADYIADAIVDIYELYFEAMESPNPQAVANALELLPLLAKAGAGITQNNLDSAKYNCPPAIQAELQKLPVTT